MIQGRGSATASGSTHEHLLELRGISKRFGETWANRRVDFSVRRGEVHALIGENGAGKTTLMNIAYGLHAADEGEIVWQGRNVAMRSPRDAIALRIGMVHQHFMLVPVLTVAENLALGTAGMRPRRVNVGRFAREISSVSERYGMPVDPWRRVDRLSVGEQQRVEILRTLLRGAELLILDEPTSVLTPQETADLFRVLRGLSADAKSVVFISHKLSEVMDVADTITVLRDGRQVSCHRRDDVTAERLAFDMVGRDLSSHGLRRSHPGSATVARVRALSIAGDGDVPVLDDVTFDVRQGEIFALAGVSGNGQEQLAKGLYGLVPVSAGRIVLFGEDTTGLGTRELISRGVGFIPQDRQAEGLVLDLNVGENLSTKTYHRSPFSHGPWLRVGAMHEAARRVVEAYDIRPSDTFALARSLSGGNQQKVIVGRELSRRPGFLIAVQPTQGVDIGAEQTIEDLLLEYKRAGAGVLLVSTDLEQILRLSDRIGVMFRGRLMGVVKTEEATMEELGLLMAGQASAA